MNELENGTSHYGAQMDGIVRENPTRAILLGLGAGLAVALIIRALQPRPHQNRAARLLDDLRERLNDLAEPAYRRASGLADDGASLVHAGAAQLSNLHLDRRLHRATSKFRSLFR